jgi:hypothetical protein
MAVGELLANTGWAKLAGAYPLGAVVGVEDGILDGRPKKVDGR